MGGFRPSQNSNMPRPKGDGNGENGLVKAVVSAAAKQQGKPDPLTEGADPAAGDAVANDAQAPVTATPLPAKPATPAAPLPPPEPVTQQMTNVTPAKITPVGAKLEKAGAAGNVQSAAAPAASPAPATAAMPPAMQQAAARPGAAAMAANQISTGANQFMAPSLNGITFGGS
jgi:hypothetical protein